MAQPPLSFTPNDIALAHASHSLLTRLIGVLIEKDVITQDDAAKIVLECVSAQEIGGPLNKLAAEILKKSVAPQPPTSQSTN